MIPGHRALKRLCFFLNKKFSNTNAKTVYNLKGREQIRKLIKRKQVERESDFSRLRALYQFESEEERIVTLSWKNLVGTLQRREITATQVLEAFIAKTLSVHEKCNPVTEFIPQAHAWAKELDGLSKVKGPLHGIPFCVKDDAMVIGMDTTHGFGKKLYHPCSDSAVIVKVLQDLGAIPFVKTNVPQGLCNIGGVNPVFGATKNGRNSNLSPGGSSSGTGALVAAGGCHFGTGSDIGGSLRIPAHFNGVSTLKPTTSRLSIAGSLPPVDHGIVGLEPAVGIIGQTPNIVSTVFREMIRSGRQNVYDPMLPPIPWNSGIFESKKKLRIGYDTSMPFFPSMGDSGKTVLQAKAALESLGHTLVEFNLPDPYRYIPTFSNIILADPRGFNSAWQGEDITEDNKMLVSSVKSPGFVLSLLKGLMRSTIIPAMHSKRTPVFMCNPPSTSANIVDSVAEKRAIIKDLLEDWDKFELDAVIQNTLPFPAPIANVIPQLTIGMVYTALWNLVDFPAGVVTIGTESGEKLHEYDDEGDSNFKVAKKAIVESIGAPIGIQVIGKPFQEEMVLRIMEELEPFNTYQP